MVMPEPGEKATAVDGDPPNLPLFLHPIDIESAASLPNAHRSPPQDRTIHPSSPSTRARERNAATIRSRRRPLQRVRRPALNAGLAWRRRRRRGAAQRVVQSHPCKAVMAHWHWSTAEYSCLATTLTLNTKVLKSNYN